MTGCTARRIGVFGGTFDPVHCGHLLIAEQAREQLRLDAVLFVPAGRPPHKRGDALSDTASRVAMVQAAIRGVPAFELSLLDVDADGPSYTYALLERLSGQNPGAQLVFILGADSLADLPQWKRPDRILELATLAVAGRPSPRAASPAMPDLPGIEGRVTWIESPIVGLSSSDIRQRARAGRSIRFMVPEPVHEYIMRHALYRDGGSAATRP